MKRVNLVGAVGKQTTVSNEVSIIMNRRNVVWAASEIISARRMSIKLSAMLTRPPAAFCPSELATASISASLRTAATSASR